MRAWWRWRCEIGNEACSKVVGVRSSAGFELSEKQNRENHSGIAMHRWRKAN
jgi:hypothetical protein